LVLRIDGQDVAADGFSLFRLVEIAVQLDFGDGLGNSRCVDGFQFMFHGASSCDALDRSSVAQLYPLKQAAPEIPCACNSHAFASVSARETSGTTSSADRKIRPPRVPS